VCHVVARRSRLVAWGVSEKMPPEDSKRGSDADTPREICHLMGRSRGQFGVRNKISREK
jgi:hypothetical protein